MGLTVIHLTNDIRFKNGTVVLFLLSMMAACSVNDSGFVFDEDEFNDLSNENGGAGAPGDGDGDSAGNGDGDTTGDGDGDTTGDGDGDTPGDGDGDTTGDGDGDTSTGPCEEGVVRCDSSGTLQRCVDGAFSQDLESCGAGLCSASLEACLTCVPGSFRCQGSVLEMCDIQGSGFDSVTDCGTEEACGSSGLAGGCSACDPGTSTCVQLVTFNPNGVSESSSFNTNSYLLTCGSSGVEAVDDVCAGENPHCNAAAGECSFCEPDGYVCELAELRSCNASGTGYTNSSVSCEFPSLCDETGGTCGTAECVSGQYQCLPDGTIERCGTNGTYQDFDRCSAVGSASAQEICEAGWGETCPECSAWDRWCVGNDLYECDGSGNQSYLQGSCESCVDNGDGWAYCGTCQEGVPFCDGNYAYDCVGGAPSGTGQSCSDYCVDGRCTTCIPGAMFCNNDNLRICQDDGQGSDLVENCALSDSFCHNGLQKCVRAWPGQTFCDENGDFYRVNSQGDANLWQSCGSPSACDYQWGCVQYPWNCTEGQMRCEGATLSTCTADGYFDQSEVCASPGLCSDALGCMKPVKVGVGKAHSCAVMVSADSSEPAESGMLTCWGANESGQLGNASPNLSDAEPRPVVLRVEGEEDFGEEGVIYPFFQNVCGGDDFTCSDIYFAQEGDEVRLVACWGSNTYGQIPTTSAALGPFNWINEALFDETDPDPDDDVFPTFGLRDVTCGARFACALDASGSAYCWGSNDSGQIGIGSEEAIVRGANRINGHTFVQLRAGAQHACGIDDAGAVWCWGSGARGQLGQGGTEDSNVPVQVRSLAADAIYRPLLGAGMSGVFIEGEPEPLVWGDNGFGQLGIGNTDSTVDPVSLGNLTKTENTRAVQAALGEHMCLARGDKLWCWGANMFGQLGINDRTRDRWSPVESLDGSDPAKTLAPGQGVAAVGWGHTCAINALGQVLCWGNNGRGQVGAPNAGNRQLVPIPVRF